jgi:restriction system protein
VRAIAGNAVYTLPLVDGKELARLMIAHGGGVTVARTYQLKRVDLDYFVAEDEDPPALQPDPEG